MATQQQSLSVSEVVTSTGFAKALGLAKSTVATQIKAGKIATVRTADGFALIPRAEIDRYRRERLRGGIR